MLKNIANTCLLKTVECSIAPLRNVSSSTASVTKIHRAIYSRQYPTVLVNPDGSTYTIRYFEPRAIIALPFDLNSLTEAEKKARLDKRKPKRKIKIEAEVDDKFNANKYLQFIKKK